MRSFIIIVLYILLVPGVTIPQSILFKETFLNGSPENIWTAGFNGNNMEIHSFPGNPSGDGWVGKLGNNLSGGGVGQSYSGSYDLSDFYYEANLYIPIDQATYYGIEFRVQPEGLTAGYQFVAKFKTGGMVTPRLRFRVRNASSPAMPSSIKDWIEGEIPGGIPKTSGWHKLAVRAEGNAYWFYFDGKQLPGCPVYDYEFGNGHIGAYVWENAMAPLYLYIDDFLVTAVTTGITAPESKLPSNLSLEQNYPNPFNPMTTICYNLPERAFTQLVVYDQLGRVVRMLVNEEQHAGAHAVMFNATDLPSGYYLYRLYVGNATLQRIAALVK